MHRWPRPKERRRRRPPRPRIRSAASRIVGRGGGAAVVARPRHRLQAATRPAGRTDRPLGAPAAASAAILRNMQIAFLGFGLIGGSIARAVRANPETKDWTMSAWSPSGEGPRKAAADLVIDVAGPATSSLPLIDRLAGKWRTMIRPDAIVTDVASTKKVIVERADAAGLWFVGGHPMAGQESVGYEASDADLFVDRPWVVVPGALAGESDIERVTELAVACRANVVRMDAAVHDRAVAAISHLPLILSAALVEAVAIRPGDAKSRAAARAE